MRTYQRSMLLLLFLIAACSGDDVAGPDPHVPELTLAVAAAQSGAIVAMTGVPASATSATHWVEVAGERSPLILEGDEAAFIVPAFLDEAVMWPAPPAGAQDVEVVSASGVAARAERALTVQSLQPADGTTATVVNALGRIGPSLTTLALLMPDGTGEPRRFLFAMGGALDSLAVSPDAALAPALAALQVEPDQLRLLDALLASNGSAQRITRFASTFTTVVDGLYGAQSDGAAGAARRNATAGADIDALSDELLAQLMQLAVYLEQNTDYQTEFGSDLSAVLGIVSILGIDLARVTPIGKILDVIAVHSTLQALLVRTYVLSALPSRLDSLTLDLARDTITPDAETAATVTVFAANVPHPVSLGDYVNVFQNIAGLFAKGDYFDKAFNFMLGKTNDLLKWWAENDASFEYDPNLVDLWSLPALTFEATVSTRELLVLRSRDEGVVVPHPSQVTWMATAIDSGNTMIWVEPSVGQATVPILMEWFADFISMNSGSASDLVLGAFGSEIVASEQVPVWVAPPGELDVTGSWTLVVEQVCTGTLSVTQDGTALSVSGSLGGGFCPYTAQGDGTGEINGNRIQFGLAIGTGNGHPGSVEFQGTVAADGNSMSGTFGGGSGEWQATRD